MIIKLTPTTITEKCLGSFFNGAPCTNTRTINFTNLILGSSPASIYSFGPLLIMTRSAGITLQIVDPGTLGALDTTRTGNDIKVTLENDGSHTVTSFSQLYSSLLSFSAIFSISLIGDGTTVVPILAKRTFPFRSTVAGNINELKLPQCPTCLSYTSYIRTWDSGDPTSPSYIRRCATNFLCQELKRLGYIHPACKDLILAEVGVPPDLLTDYPVGDGTL